MYIECTLLCTFVVDCELSEWTEWSSCSESCSYGKKHRTRYVIKEALYNGKECQGSQNETDWCIIRNCPPGKFNKLQTMYSAGV